MDLSAPSTENIEYMIEEIKRKLKMATGAALNAANFNTERYEDLLDIYDLVSSKDHFSINEMEAIVSELGSLRKKS